MTKNEIIVRMLNHKDVLLNIHSTNIN